MQPMPISTMDVSEACGPELRRSMVPTFGSSVDSVSCCVLMIPSFLIVGAAVYSMWSTHVESPRAVSLMLRMQCLAVEDAVPPPAEPSESLAADINRQESR
jgi:hypothetical protein